jgi:hypothetical protein
LNQDIPFGHGLLHTTSDALASAFDAHAALRAPERVGAGIDRIGGTSNSLPVSQPDQDMFPRQFKEGKQEISDGTDRSGFYSSVPTR